MENILLVVNGGNHDTNTVDFACYIANLTHSKLTGVFVEMIEGEERPVLKQLYALPYIETITAKDLPENVEKIISFDANERIFLDACINRGVIAHIHPNRKLSTREIIQESRFADLIIVNPETSLGNEIEGIPSHFVREILANSECPVLLAPYTFDGLDEIVFSYDGSKSSVFAIREFAHLFPGLSDKKITVLQIEKTDTSSGIDSSEINELLKSHFSNIKFEHLQGEPNDQLFGWLLGKRNMIVVMGSYGR